MVRMRSPVRSRLLAPVLKNYFKGNQKIVKPKIGQVSTKFLVSVFVSIFLKLYREKVVSARSLTNIFLAIRLRPVGLSEAVIRCLL